jgi:FAD-linked sulfhydryl oxidase
MSKKRWSIPTWYLLHGIAEKIKEDYYIKNKDDIINILNDICYNLPCPYCRTNAIKYLKSKNFALLKTKQDFKLFIFNFHNNVNKKLNKKIFDKNILKKYKTINLLNVWKLFDKEFNSNYLTSHDFNKWRRNISSSYIKKYFNKNWTKMFENI